MPKFEATYDIAKFGFATSFTESEQPPTFAQRMRNRFINSAGGAEKRQGIVQKGNNVPGTPELTNIHEFVDKTGAATLLVSGEGSIYKFDDSSDYTAVFSGWDEGAKIRSIQAGGKLIFFNGVNRNIFTEDGSTFKRLRSVVIRGIVGGSAATTRLDDGDVESWLVDTDIVTNDVVFNVTRGGYGIVTDVVSGHVTHTQIGTGGTGLGNTSANQAAGDRYVVIDLVALDIIETDDINDNTATAGPDTNATTVAVSGVNFLNTDIKPGDFVSNTTRSSIAMVSSVATALTTTSVASQASGDALVFLKEAMPITSNGHVHFGRSYYIDARDKTKVLVSGPDSPEDLTTDAATIDSSTFAFGEQQPDGEVVLDMASFQRFLGIAGKQNLLMYSGVDPIADTSADSKSFDIIGLFPQGIVSPDSLVSIGNDLVFVTPDGVQTASLVGDASTLGRANISEAIKTELRGKIKNTAEGDILVTHYPRRSWFMLHIGSDLYVFNYAPFFGQDRINQAGFGAASSGPTLGPNRGSWSYFDGKFSRQNAYFVRQSGDLVCAGAGGKVYDFDTGQYSDDGETYTTEYKTSWLTLSEPRDNIKKKQGNYIKPVFDTGATVSYTVRAEGEFAGESGETITINTSGANISIGQGVIPHKIGGSSIINEKHALRWRGEQARITFETQDQVGPDTIAQFTLYGNQFGTR